MAGPKDHAIMYTIGNNEISARMISMMIRTVLRRYSFFLSFKCLEYNPVAIIFTLSCC